MTTKPPPKRDVMLALLQHAESVFVNFDPRRDGVVVPAHLKRQPRVVLQYGLNMRIPIPDLDVGEDGIGATLSFEGRPTWTFVPWSAVFAIISQDQKGMLWESDLPREIEAEHKKQTAPGEAKKSAQPPNGKDSADGAKGRGLGNAKRPAAVGKRPSLRAVDGGGEKLEGPKPELREADAVAAVPLRAEPVLAAVSSTEELPKAGAVSSTEEPPKAASAIEPAPAEPPPPPADRPNDEIVELPQPEPKKKREIPSYLRVVK